MKIIVRICLTFLGLIPFLMQAQSIKSPLQVIPELYPVKTIKVAFHVIHRYSVDDTFNLPDDSLANFWWNSRIDSINRYLAKPAKPNYEHYKDYERDSKIRIENVGVYHHVDSNYWVNAEIPQFYHRFVSTNPEFGTLEKDSVLHSFYYGDNKWGGKAGGIPTRWGMRFKGRYQEFWHYRRYPPMGHKRNDNNYIHELGHCLGLYHNYKNSNNGQGTQCTGCDAHLGGFCFDMQAEPYAANNFMAKGTNVGPWGHSFTYCQLQRILYNVYSMDSSRVGKRADIGQCSDQISPCSQAYHANLRDSTVLDYDFEAYGSIEIPKGGVFIVRSILKMPAGSSIILQAGSRLIVDGGQILRNDSCSGNWNGINRIKKDRFWRFRSKTSRALSRPGSIELLNGGQIQE